MAGRDEPGGPSTGEPAGPATHADPASGRGLLDRFVVVLHEPQDLVNVALVIRAMKNMGLGRLRVVRPDEEFDPYRIDGIAHGTEDVVAATELHETLDEALADATYVVGTSARRRASRQQWWTAEEGAGRLVDRAPSGDIALLFGREDRGLSNRDLDRCHALIGVPTSPEHPSLNLGHAAVLLFYELRKAADERAGLPRRDMSAKGRRTTPAATAAELEGLFEAWEAAMERIGFFHHIDPLPKMRSFRSIFQRADLDRRELGLLRAAAYEILHYARRTRIRLRQQRGLPEEEAPDAADDDTDDTAAEGGP